MSDNLKEVRELTKSRGKISAEGSASAKALRPEHAWRVSETARRQTCVATVERVRERTARDKAEQKEGPKHGGFYQDFVT